MRTLDVICWVLLVIGGLNWGLVGLFEFDLVAALFGGPEAILSKIIYTLVGLSAVYELFALRGQTRRWGAPARVVRTERHV